ncbi:transcriptional regulator PadR family protein [Gemmatirosa kalamazoonensis]|jgi:DNA-binding PadR family transcriptional regulator|uniref:Transcriptional regulator PadR family protein n=1 Tax=Gemmatirosa kalamazoonensis TaxID=861299 RepID=W0RP16_9BACT|nr:PadR family transcriptional regulator [Gemmatirosa kalamazoonensis]AHG91188.1 transcriptional regulator PadR family protein [Gemmatirosa kalamazoonensis]
MFTGFSRTADGWQWCNAREGDPDFGNFIGIFAGKRPGGGGRRGGWGRMFEQGDLKLVVLKLLEEKPRHGYEIIKALEEKTSGMYSPSPGAVYPTLTLLEELGYARAVDEGAGRKIYEITDEGRKHLAEHRTAADDVFERVSHVAGAGVELFGELASAFGALGRAAFKTASKSRGDRDLLKKVRDIIERAEHDIETLG